MVRNEQLQAVDLALDVVELRDKVLYDPREEIDSRGHLLDERVRDGRLLVNHLQLLLRSGLLERECSVEGGGRATAHDAVKLMGRDPDEFRGPTLPVRTQRVIAMTPHPLQAGGNVVVDDLIGEPTAAFLLRRESSRVKAIELRAVSHIVSVPEDNEGDVVRGGK